MSQNFIPVGYKAALGQYETQRAIEMIKNVFADRLSDALSLHRVSAPLFVASASGLNDDLNGVERPVSFTLKEGGLDAQVVHSLAKWKRQALRDYGFHSGTGLYTDMNAIRRDEDLDNLHSAYVDQWDWEKVIEESQRTPETLHDAVTRIVAAICATQSALHKKFPELAQLPPIRQEICFVTTQQLEDRWPDYTPKERENAICKEQGTVFLEQIGGTLRSGQKHDGRAPDYDDWKLNGDLLFWNPVLNSAIELSSMGIRVSPQSLAEQLKLAGAEARRALPFHKALLAGELPYTMGGGIGQSRLCMLLLGCAHIGQVQCSIWDEETRRVWAEAGVTLL